MNKRNFIGTVTILLFLVALVSLVFAGYTTSNYKEVGGARWVIGGSLDVASGGDLDIESGGAIKIAGTAVTSAAAELNKLDGVTVVTADLNAIKTATVNLTNAQIKAMRASPVELVAAPGAGNVLEFMGAILILNYGSNVLTESTDNMAVEYNAGTAATASDAIESGSFIDAAADTITTAVPVKDVVDASADIVNKNLALANTGDGEFGGNAGADTLMTVITTYRVHATGL